jgi:hypothetical protein
MMDQTSTYSQSTLSFDSFLNTQIARRSPLSQQEHRCLEQLYNTRKLYVTYCVAKPGPTFSYKQARMYTVSYRTVLQDLITVHAFTLDSLPFPTSNHTVGVVIVVLVLERTRKRWGIPTFISNAATTRAYKTCRNGYQNYTRVHNKKEFYSTEHQRHGIRYKRGSTSHKPSSVSARLVRRRCATSKMFHPM